MNIAIAMAVNGQSPPQELQYAYVTCTMQLFAGMRRDTRQLLLTVYCDQGVLLLAAPSILMVLKTAPSVMSQGISVTTSRTVLSLRS